MVGNLNKMSAIRKNKESNTVTTVQKYFQQKHNVSHFSVWNVQYAMGMFSYACRCYSKQISARRCTAEKKQQHLEPAMEMIEIGNRLRFVWSEQLIQSRQTQKWVFLCRCRVSALQQRGVIDLFIQYHSTWCGVRNFDPLSVNSHVHRGGLLAEKYKDGLFCDMRRNSLCL